MSDIFEPGREPAKSIYLAFQKEAGNRKGRTVGQWVSAERDAVYREAIYQAQKLGLRTPSFEEIERAERYAMGSVDYGAKWAYRIVDAMQKKDGDRGNANV